MSGQCTPDGQCGVDGDCTAPTTCGKGSRTCLDPGACAAAADCPGGQICSGAGTCEIGSMCGQTEFALTQIKPNLMVLLDRSGSMSDRAGNDSRWNVARSAIAGITTAFDKQIRFGLATYSACLPGGCAAGTIVVPIADGNANAINTFLGKTVDSGSNDGKGVDSQGKIRYLCDSEDSETSTGKSLNALVGHTSLQDPTRPNAVVLLTDGDESSSCVDGCDGPCGAMRLAAQNPPVKTFVIGFGINSTSIDAIASAGMTMSPLSATNQMELNAAFAQIAAAVATCEYALDSKPPDLNQLHVFFNDAPTPVSRDATNGWSYDAANNKVVFSGEACTGILAGNIKDIDVVFGCPAPIVL